MEFFYLFWPNFYCGKIFITIFVSTNCIKDEPINSYRKRRRTSDNIKAL